jgi:Mce-associated membrane protein
MSKQGGSRWGTGGKALVAVAAVLALVGVGAGGWFGYSWWSAVRHNSTSAVQLRDSAVEAAKQLAVTLQTVDPAQPAQAYQAWKDAATGPLLAKLSQDEQNNVNQLKKAPTRSFATPVEAALSALNTDEGTATAIIALDVTQAAVTNGVAGPPTVKQLRVKLSLARTDAGWKVSNSGLINS